MPRFEMNHNPDFGQNIANAWPRSIDDTGPNGIGDAHCSLV